MVPWFIKDVVCSILIVSCSRCDIKSDLNGLKSDCKCTSYYKIETFELFFQDCERNDYFSNYGMNLDEL